MKGNVGSPQENYIKNGMHMREFRQKNLYTRLMRILNNS